MKFQKKPIIIEAIDASEVLDAAGRPEWQELPVWIRSAWDKGIIILNNPIEVIIITLEGSMVANREYKIIQGIKGELYPCKLDIFEVSYQPVVE